MMKLGVKSTSKNKSGSKSKRSFYSPVGCGINKQEIPFMACKAELFSSQNCPLLRIFASNNAGKGKKRI